jgi:hypothetical protein
MSIQHLLEALILGSRQVDNNGVKENGKTDDKVKDDSTGDDTTIGADWFIWINRKLLFPASIGGTPIYPEAYITTL